jgi:hypothetical protein
LPGRGHAGEPRRVAIAAAMPALTVVRREVQMRPSEDWCVLGKSLGFLRLSTGAMVRLDGSRLSPRRR